MINSKQFIDHDPTPVRGRMRTREPVTTSTTYHLTAMYLDSV
jgi:hypothetical protein